MVAYPMERLSGDQKNAPTAPSVPGRGRDSKVSQRMDPELSSGWSVCQERDASAVRRYGSRRRAEIVGDRGEDFEPYQRHVGRPLAEMDKSKPCESQRKNRCSSRCDHSETRA